MSHYFVFSIAGAHVNNAKKELELMSDVKQYKSSDYNYDNNFNEIFYENVRHGILTIYSINAALESIVAILNRKLNYEKSSFYERIDILKNKSIIKSIKAYNKCIELRKYRNLITHWENENSKLLGTIHYLPYMVGDEKPTNEKKKLISMLTKENLKKFFNSFIDLINDINKNLDNDAIKYYIESILDGDIIFEV